VKFDRTELENRLNKLAEKIYNLPGRLTGFEGEILHNGDKVHIIVSSVISCPDYKYVKVPVFKVKEQGSYVILQAVRLDLLVSIALGMPTAVEEWLKREASVREKTTLIEGALAEAESMMEAEHGIR